jgi:hypothetical protein
MDAAVSPRIDRRDGTPAVPDGAEAIIVAVDGRS